MNYEEICERIHIQILSYQQRHGLQPNRVILGKAVFDFILSRNHETVTLFRIVDDHFSYTIFGIIVVENFHSPNEISVGYLEEINL